PTPAASVDDTTTTANQATASPQPVAAGRARLTPTATAIAARIGTVTTPACTNRAGTGRAGQRVVGGRAGGGTVGGSAGGGDAPRRDARASYSRWSATSTSRWTSDPSNGKVAAPQLKGGAPAAVARPVTTGMSSRRVSRSNRANSSPPMR